MFQFTQIESNIQETLHKRINALTRSGEFNPLDPTAEQQSNAVSEMLTKTCWVRVTSSIPEYKKYQAEDDDGKSVVHPDNGKFIRPLEVVSNKPFRLSGNFKNGQPINRPITSKVNLMNNPSTSTLRAPAGVTGVSTSFKNHSIQNVTINWKLYDREDFDVYEQGFLKHGRIVLVEFGWNVPNVNLGTMEKPQDMLQYYENIQQRILNSGGDYYAAIGKIKSFNYDIGPNGEFDCTTELTSMGSTLFKGAIDTQEPIPEVILQKNKEKIADAYNDISAAYETYIKDLDKVIKKDYEAGEVGTYYNPNTEKGYCTWGWFEDIILNTWFAFVSETESEKELTTEIRSIGSGFKNKEGTLEKIDGDNPCRFGPDLFTKDSHIILPGRISSIDSLKEASEDERFQEKVREEYKNTYDTFKEINDSFETFEFGSDRGSIRRMVFSADYLKNFFGSVRDIESALSSMWQSVSSVYGGYWNFEVIQDDNNNGRIGVIDSFKPEQRVAVVNPNVDSSKLSKPGNTNEKTFVFPLYSTRSLFKDFNLQVNLSSAMATQAMYHSQKNFSKEGQNTTNKPEDLSITALASIQNQSMTDPEGQGTQTHDALLKDYHSVIKGKDGEGAGRTARKNPSEANSDLVVKPIDFKVEGDPIADSIRKQNEVEAAAASEEEIKKADEGIRLIDTNSGLIYKSDGEMMGAFQRGMDYLLNKKDEANVDVDPVTPIEVSFSMPGIGGIRMYDIFAVDYLPDNYRRYGLFQVSGIDHTLSPQGWDTKISGKLRVDMDTLIKDAKSQNLYQENSVEISTEFSETDNINFLTLIQNTQKEETEKSNQNN